MLALRRGGPGLGRLLRPARPGLPACRDRGRQVVFAHQANGSLMRNGSLLAGQNWTGARWFHGRPDAGNPMATGGTTRGPPSTALVKAAATQIAALKKEGITPTPGLVTTSGSGVDPDISPADAYAQASAVAKARRVPVTGHPPPGGRPDPATPQFGFLGSPDINVLQLHQALQPVGRSR